MATTESVTIEVPVGMSKYLVTVNPETELTRNALAAVSIYIKPDDISWPRGRNSRD